MARHYGRLGQERSKDPLLMFIRECCQYDVMDRDTEQSIGYAKTNAPTEKARLQARTQLVLSNIPFAFEMARRYHLYHPEVPLIDLALSATQGLIKAADTYDASTGFRFCTYAGKKVCGYIMAARLQESQKIRLPKKSEKNLRRIETFRNRYYSRHGRDPGIEVIGRKLDLKVKTVETLLSYTKDVISLDICLNDDSSGTLLEMVSTNRDSTLETILENEKRVTLLFALSKLPKTQAEILIKRYGLMDGVTHTFQQIGDIFGTSRENIQQREKHALRILRIPEYSGHLRVYYEE